MFSWARITASAPGTAGTSRAIGLVTEGVVDTLGKGQAFRFDRNGSSVNLSETLLPVQNCVPM